MPRPSLDDLFDAALDIPLQRRTAWLDAACAGDAGLRHELELLLAADAREQGVLESGPALLADVMADATDTPRGFGAWRVLRRLGAGGMGEVWLAERDDAGFVQRAAIKQVAWPTPGLLQRFQRERQILAQLEHPGVARLIDGGVDAAGCPYLAMEYVQGERIDAWVRTRALDVRTTVRLLLQVCEAVQFAHRNLVVHSDIKPSNILITDEGAPRLLDFGIARVLSGDDAEATRTATRLMTPDYAAPEWLKGGPVTTAVDVYALGVLAYELLSGTKPYRLERGGDLARQLGERVTPPPSAALARDAPDRRVRRRALRGDLDRIVQTAMALDPARRYATVEALAQDLRAWLDGRAVAARGDDAWYRVRKFVARNRVAVAAAAVVALTLAAATVYSVHQARIARVQMHRAEAVRVFLADTFTQIDPAGNQGKTVGMRELLERSERRLVNAGDVPLQVRVDLATLIGTFYWNLADNVASERVLQRAVAMAAHGGVDGEVRSRALLALARVEGDRFENEAAWRHATQALTLARQADRPDPDLIEAAQRIAATMAIAYEGPVRAEQALRQLLAHDRARHGDSQKVADDLISLVQALMALQRYDEAEAAGLQAIEVGRRVQGPFGGRVGLAQDLVGEIRVLRGDYAGARPMFAATAKAAGTLWGADNVRTSIVRRQLLQLAVLEGRFRQSLPAVQAMRDEALALRDARPDHAASGALLLADTWLGLGQFASAERAYRATFPLLRAMPNGEHSDAMASAFSDLALVLRWQGRLDEAETSVRKAVAIDRNLRYTAENALPRDLASARDLSVLGVIVGLRGHPRQALQHLRAAVARLPGEAQSELPLHAQVRARLAQALLDVGDTGAALAQARLAQAIADRRLPPGNWQRAVVQRVLGLALLATGRVDDAEASLERVVVLLEPVMATNDPRVVRARDDLARVPGSRAGATTAVPVPATDAP
jgi:serine/threonine-protein kinase